MARSRLRVWAATGCWLMLAAAQPGCRRPTGCPAGTAPIAGRATAAGLWCQGAEPGHTFWVELYPGTKQARQACPFIVKSLDGHYQSWHPEGAAWVSGTYAHGRRQGRWLQVDGAGKKVAAGDYRDGQLVQGVPVGVSATCDSIAAP